MIVSQFLPCWKCHHRVTHKKLYGVIKSLPAAVLPLKILLMSYRIWHDLRMKKPMLWNLGVQHEFYKPLFVPLNNSMIFRGVYHFQVSLLPFCSPTGSQEVFTYSIRTKAKAQSLCGKDFRGWSRQVCQRHVLSYIGQNLTWRGETIN